MNFFDNINYNQILDYLMKYGLVFLKAIVILIIGLKLIKWITNLINKKLEKSNIDPSLRSFLTPLVSVILKTALVISIATTVGIEMTSFIALLGSIGFGIGLALQGSLSNFAGGVLILLIKPYKIGDYIEADGFSGTVTNIHIFYTVLATIDNKKVIIPNSKLSNSSLINYSAYKTRRIEFKISCSYDNDIDKVKKILIDLASSHDLVLKDPIPEVYLVEYGNSSIVFSVRIWVKSSDYWPVYYDLLHKVKGEFDKNNISIPYPQLDVHLVNENKLN